MAVICKLHVGKLNLTGGVCITDLDANSIIITGKNAALSFDNVHDRTIKSWHSSRGQQISSPLNYSDRDSSVTCVLNNRKLCKWQIAENTGSIDNFKKWKLNADVFALVKCKQESGEVNNIYIVYSNGSVTSVDSYLAHEEDCSESPPAALSDVVLSVDTVVYYGTCTLDNGTDIICVIVRGSRKLRRTKQEDCYRIILYAINNGITQIYCHTTDDGNQKVTVNCWCLASVKGQPTLVALGVDNELFNIPVTYSTLLCNQGSGENSWNVISLSQYQLHTFHLPPQYSITKESSIDIHSLRDNTLVIGGVRKDSFVAIIYHILYNVIICEMSLQGPLMESGKKLFVCGQKVYYVSDDDEGCVVQYDCGNLPALTLASMITYKHQQLQQPAALLQASPTTVTWKNETQPEAMDTELSDLQSAKDKLEKLLTTKSVSDVGISNQWRVITSSSCNDNVWSGDGIIMKLVHNRHVIIQYPSLTVTILSHLLTQRHVSNRCMKECISELIEMGHFLILYHVIFSDTNNIDDNNSIPSAASDIDLDEELIVKLVKRVLNYSEPISLSGIPSRCSGMSSPLSKRHSVRVRHQQHADTQPQPIDHRLHLITKVLMLHFNNGLMTLELKRHFNIIDVRMLLSHINERLVETNINRSLFASAYGEQLCNWLTCLLDAHFLSLCMATDSYDTLVTLKNCIDLQVDYIEQLGILHHIVDVLESKRQRGERHMYNDYRIEVIHFT